MKNLRNCYAAFLLFALLFVAAAAPAQTDLQQKLGRISAITETRPLESTRFSEKYVTYFTQPLDHRRPEKGSFRQRVIVSHVGFDRPTVIVTEGYGAAYALNPKYREELSELLDANMIFVEYRYFLESTPEPKDWQYLTAENSADDLHAVRNAFKSISRQMDCDRHQQGRTDYPALPHVLSGRRGYFRALCSSALLRGGRRTPRAFPQESVYSGGPQTD